MSGNTGLSNGCAVIAGLLALVMLAGCGPYLRDEKTYISPQTTEGITRASACRDSTLACSAAVTRREEACIAQEERRARLEHRYYLIAQNALSDEQKDDPLKDYDDFMDTFACRRIAREERAVCESSYDTCWLRAGGRIQVNTVCVAGCADAGLPANTPLTPEEVSRAR